MNLKRAIERITYYNSLVLRQESMARATYILLGGLFGPQANAVRTECYRGLHPTSRFVQIKGQNALHFFSEEIRLGITKNFAC